MATLKPTVKTKLKTGMYIVYIRVVQTTSRKIKLSARILLQSETEGGCSAQC